MNLPIPDKASYLAAKPFPHCMIDGAFDPVALDELLEAWPSQHEFFTSDYNITEKGHTASEKKMGPRIAAFIYSHFAVQEFIGWLEGLTGIEGLVFDCRRFAINETFRDGILRPHLDCTTNPITGLQLRVNIILYLNHNWKADYKGELTLYKTMKDRGDLLWPEVSIEPAFNRMVIFTMDADKPAWHGSREPLNCPEGMSRKTIAVNYFTLPQKNVTDERTIFEGQRKSLLKEWLPPVIHRLIRK